MTIFVCLSVVVVVVFLVLMWLNVLLIYAKLKSSCRSQGYRAYQHTQLEARISQSSSVGNKFNEISNIVTLCHFFVCLVFFFFNLALISVLLLGIWRIATSCWMLTVSTLQST